MDLLTRMWDLVFVSGPKRTSKCGWTEDGHMTRVICNGLTDKHVGPGVCFRSEKTTKCGWTEDEHMTRVIW